MKLILILFFSHFSLAQSFIHVSDVHEKARQFVKNKAIISLEGMSTWEKHEFFQQLPLETEMVFAFVEAESPSSPVYKIKVFPGRIRKVLPQALYATVSVHMFSDNPQNVKVISGGLPQLQSVPFDYINMIFADESVCQAALY